MTTSSPILTRSIKAVRRWIGDAQAGRLRLASLTMISTQALRAAERNAFELGRDHERGSRGPLTRRLTSA